MTSKSPTSASDGQQDRMQGSAATRCANCDGEIIRADVTMNGPRGPWIHEATRTRMCQDGFTTPRFAEPCDD